MKKTIIIIILYIILILISLIIFQQNKKNTVKEEELYQNIPFYKERLYPEYLDYQKKYHLSIFQTILNVNIGLNHPFYHHTSLALRPNTIYMLVNKYHYVDKDFVPTDLIKIPKYGKKGITLNHDAYNAFLQMVNDMEKENLHLQIISGYRSFDYQEKLYNSYLKNDSQEKVDSYSARPGFSEHHTGLAIDVQNDKIDYNKFHLTKEYLWLTENAYKYGFILRYPLGKEKITGYKFEAWHYRYVGKDAAQVIHQNHLTYEEYYYQYLDNSI